MYLTDQEKSMLDGTEGVARQKAMELIVRYGQVLVMAMVLMPASVRQFAAALLCGANIWPLNGRVPTWLI